MFSAHRLPISQFAALARGAGDYRGELRAGQVSKRVLQLLAMRADILATCRDQPAGRHFAAGYDLLAAVQRRSAGAVDTVLGYPQVGAWAARTVRRMVDPTVDRRALDDDLGHLAAIAAAAALTAGEGFELTLRVRADGTVMIPMFGLARLAVPPAWCRARAEPGGASVGVDIPGGTAEIPVRSAASSPRWWPVRRLASTAAGQRIAVCLDDVDPYRDSHRLGAAGRLGQPDTDRWQAALDQAWAQLARRHPDRAAALAAGIGALVPLRPDGRSSQRSGSTGEACGAVALTRPSGGTALAAALVHEFQHTKLSALLDLVRLHRDSGADNDRYAPWRSDPRPLSGLLQGAYAYLGLVDYWQVERLAGHEGHHRVAHFEFARWRQAVRQTLLALSTSGQLTAVGERFVGGMRGQLARLCAGPVPPEPAFLAGDALDDHRIRWRLHNLRPDQGQVTACARAWLAGDRCPPVTPRRATVRASAPQWSGGNARLELAYRRLRDPVWFETAVRTDPPAETPGTAADLAYALADYRAAARLYQQTVAKAPDEIDAWAGLALAYGRLAGSSTSFVRACPEFVRALHQRLGEAGPSPLVAVLAGWLDAGQRPEPGPGAPPVR